MTSGLQILFLGTGTSTGVPLIGCECAVCQSDNPGNKRLRSSIIVEGSGTRILVDSSPDLRQQALREGLASVDAVLYTHCHLDHVAGFDDMRAFCWHHVEPLPLYASQGTMNVLHAMYPWAFSPENTYLGYIRPAPHVIGDESFFIGAIRVTPVPVLHGSVETHGYVFECGGVRVGYACDAKSIPESSLALLTGLDALILDCLRRKEHPTHLCLEETLEIFRKVHPAQGVLTHMSHDLDIEIISPMLPKGTEMARDGMRLGFTAR